MAFAARARKGSGAGGRGRGRGRGRARRQPRSTLCGRVGLLSCRTRGEARGEQRVHEWREAAVSHIILIFEFKHKLCDSSTALLPGAAWERPRHTLVNITFRCAVAVHSRPTERTLMLSTKFALNQTTASLSAGARLCPRRRRHGRRFYSFSPRRFWSRKLRPNPWPRRCGRYSSIAAEWINNL